MGNGGLCGHVLTGNISTVVSAQPQPVAGR